MVKRRIQRWLLQKAEEALGEEEFNSLKNDLVGPVKIAAKVRSVRCCLSVFCKFLHSSVQLGTLFCAQLVSLTKNLA